MNTSIRTSKLASIFTTVCACAGLALGSTGCFIDGRFATDDPIVVDTTPAIAEIAIDPGATMTSAPGKGTGLFVQYDEGGHWRLFTTCDTEITGRPCDFDVIISADRDVALDNVEARDLGAGDIMALAIDGSINLSVETSFGTNGMSFDADPGATIEIDMLLDGVAQPRFVFAVSDGVALEGVPTNPVDFTPAGF